MYECPNIKFAVTHIVFLQIIAVGSFIFILPLMLMGNYKDYASKKGLDNDYLLTIIGSFGGVSNALFRVIAGGF